MAGPTLRAIREVGRYAVGIDWSDGHDSILPYRHLRLSCQCDACLAEDPAATIDAHPAAIELVRMQQIGDGTLFFAWGDRHESLFVAPELRALCRCAHCIGEPDYPISGR